MRIFIGLLVASLVVIAQCKESAKSRVDMPSFFLRKLKTWKSDKCEFKKLRSVPVKISLIKMDGKLAHVIQVKLASGGYPFKKIELRLEITGISRTRVEKMARRKYIANVQVVGNPPHRRNVTILPTFGKDGLLELALDITAVANNVSRTDSPTKLNFAFRIHRSSGKVVKTLLRRDIKAFLIVYESVESCNLMDFIASGEIQKYPDIRNMEVRRFDLKHWTRSTDEMCGRRSLKVKLEDIGLKGIIVPEEIDIGICSGFCTSGISKTGYAFLRNAYDEKLHRGRSFCCQPSEFGLASMIYTDPFDRSLVLTRFSDMVIKRCDCQ